MNSLAISRAADSMRQAGDKGNAEKMGELRKKLEEKELYVAFCGHFSAGKSSMINKLCGTRLLPSSPIPTSANVVTIRHGEPSAIIHRAGSEGSGAAEERIPLEELDAYCKNGTDIESVEIHHPIPLLKGHTALLDTPGIDSTDDAHKMATESALHLADVVFYVMDYNHVQSEMNLVFTKMLKDWGKPSI
ncbi:dynamin family protein [Paenibacillus sp. CC-CFT747]|nr:dynamin family protein [Paenibacillus sp. CC-CFT747]